MNIHLPFHLDGLLDNSKSSPDSQLCIIMHAYNVRCIIYRLSQSNHRLCVTLHTFVCKNTKIKHTISLFDNKYGKIFAFMSFSSIKSEKKGNTVQHFAIHYSIAYNTFAALQKRPFDMTGKPLSPHHKARFTQRNAPFCTTKTALQQC